MLMVRLPENHDLLLEFSLEAQKELFLSTLEILLGSKVHAEIRSSRIQVRELFYKQFVMNFESWNILLNSKLQAKKRSELLAMAETQEKRRKKLERFFKEAYMLTFGLRWFWYATLLNLYLCFLLKEFFKANNNQTLLIIFFLPPQF